MPLQSQPDTKIRSLGSKRDIQGKFRGAWQMPYVAVPPPARERKADATDEKGRED